MIAKFARKRRKKNKMVEITTILDVLAAILLATAAVYIFKIGRITGWFRAWALIAATFIIAIVLRLFSIYQSYSTLDAATVNYIRAALNLAVSICALIGYTSLYRLFKEKKGQL